MGLDQTAQYTTYQNALSDVSRGVQREKEALDGSISRIDQSVASLTTLQQEFFDLSVKIDNLLATDPDNAAYINQKAAKDQLIPDFTALRDDASAMATAMDPFRSAE